MLLVKSELNKVEVLTTKALIDSYISHDEFVLVPVLKEHNDKKEALKSPNNRQICCSQTKEFPINNVK